MNDTPSLINLVNEFKSLQIRHKAINDFGTGDTYDIDRDGNIKYPFMWVEIGPTTMIYSEANADYVYDEIEFNVYILDKVREGDKNELDIWSDTHDYLRQCMKQLAQSEYYRNNMIKIFGDRELERATHELDSDLNGYMANITLRVPNRMTPCNSPFSDPFNTTI